MKRIVICLDGTWNKSGACAADEDTNVYRLYQSAENFRSSRQLAFYDAGVGTQFLERVRGGVFGYGLYDQIKEGYLQIVESYQPGDRVFLVGFSRGAFSARCLASFLMFCGVLKRQSWSFSTAWGERPVDHLWDLYRNRQSDSKALQSYCAENCYRPDDPLVEAVGVWDTVGALGVPWEIFGKSALAGLAQRHETERLGFLDTRLAPGIGRAYHALALDEQRVPFRPTLWDDPRVSTGQIQQVWFAGVHSNVGGGFADRGLSDISLDWMIRNLSRHHGLELSPVQPDPEGLWDPVGMTGMDQSLENLDDGLLNVRSPRVVPANSLLHPTAVLRIKGDARHAGIPCTADLRLPYLTADM